MKPAMLLLLTALASGAGAGESRGEFFREHWYERGTNSGNPKFASRFRVNAGEAVLHREFGQRIEMRENGMMQILAEEDLRLVTRAELYLELWGGHPGTENKRVGVNGRSLYPIAEVGTASHHCTHEYPTIPLKRTDLVNGFNAFQFACDQGSTFWGHFIVDNACLRVALTNDHPALRAAQLAGFGADVCARRAAKDVLRLELISDAEAQSRIARVDFQAFYDGYDENGDGHTRDWHGFTKNRKPLFVGSATAAPFACDWNVAMLPAQDNVTVRAWVHFRSNTNLLYCTAESTTFAVRHERAVRMFLARDLPRPFWSRAGQEMRCTIDLDTDPAGVEGAELHVVIWDGGAGNVRDYFTLNGTPLRVSGGGKHDVLYRVVSIDPLLLRKGGNIVRVLSDTEHHGLEVLRPGPALFIRAAAQRD